MGLWPPSKIGGPLLHFPGFFSGHYSAWCFRDGFKGKEVRVIAENEKTKK